MSADEGAVVLFDGDCALCNGCIRWLLRHERTARYRFAALQSPAAAPLLARHGVPATDLSSVLVVDQDRLYRKTDAVFHVLRDMRWPWPLLRVLRLVPRRLRDAIYDAIGARRLRWWGRVDVCITATPALRARLLPSLTDSANS